MSLITNCIKNKDTTSNPIWLMRQAGRYLPEFREIRKKNQDFIKLCLNNDLASEITLQPIRRFGFDGAVIFSDILMLPYGLGQKVEFEKNFGPKLGNRSWRYMAVITDGIVEKWWEEPGINNEGSDDDPYLETMPEKCLEYLAAGSE